MASAGPAATGKRAMDVEVNLVPFIDLLSCCICFLLISAVWTQVARIDVSPAPNLPSDVPPPEPKVKLTVTLKDMGYTLSDGASSLDLPKVAGSYPTPALKEKLQMFRDAYPDVAGVTVMSDDTIAYRDLIVVMD